MRARLFRCLSEGFGLLVIIVMLMVLMACAYHSGNIRFFNYVLDGVTAGLTVWPEHPVTLHSFFSKVYERPLKNFLLLRMYKAFIT